MNEFVQARFICVDVSACDALVAADNNKNEKWGVAVNLLLYAARAVSLLGSSAALALMAGNAWAAASCARPQDVTALRTAALQQQLMVAALTCHDAADYNRFVTSSQDELQKSDKALMNFFVRQDARTGADDYNAYKTWLANASSLSSQRDPKFCRSAKVAFDVALNRKGALAELASERPTPIETGYAICSPGAAKTEVADAAPSPPPRRLTLSESTPSVPVPKLAPRPLRASPAVSPQRVAAVAALPRGKADGSRIAGQLPARDSHEFGAYDRVADARIADDVGERDEFASDAADERDDAGDDAPRYAPRYADATPPRAYGNVPDAYKPGAYWVDANEAPVRPRMVRGPNGYWYLLLQFGR